MALDGVLVVGKPEGPTSHDVVICARRALGVARIGHTGTLDPRASGVLPLVVGQATRLAQHLASSDKEYEATIRFGIETDTYDAAGTVVRESGSRPSEPALRDALRRFTGVFAQTPPPYSAKLVEGERAYARARAGRAVTPAPVEVRAHAIDLVAFDGARAALRVRSSAGFYVRSLAHDLGEALGVGAMLERLVRTEAAGFRLDAAVAFDTLVSAPRADLRAAVRPMETLLTTVPAAGLTREGVRRAAHGRDLGPDVLASPPAPAAPLVRLIGPDGRLVGLAEPAGAAGVLHPSVVFSYN